MWLEDICAWDQN